MAFDVVKTRGQDFYFRGEKLRLKGFGIGTWLNMEHFMLGIPTPDSMIRVAFAEVYGEKVADAFFHSFLHEFVGEADFQLLKESGINFLRVPFNYRLLIDDNDISNYKEDGFAELKRLFDLCERYEIFVMPDLHTTPGGQNPDWHADNRSGDPQFWQFEVFRKQMVALWGEIAKRFSGYQYLLGYDLLNEPAMADSQAINQFYAETVKEIRKYDQHHIVILEGDGFAMDFREIVLPKDDNLALSFHYYPTVWHKDLLSKDLDRNERTMKLEEALNHLVVLKEQFGVPTICGEAGYDTDHQDPDFSFGLLEDTLKLFDKYDVNYCLWAYKDAGFMAMVCPKSDSTWVNFTNQIKEKWTHYLEMEQADQIIREMGNLFGGLEEEDYYILQFRLRGILYEMQKKAILLPILKTIKPEDLLQLPKSFRLQNCTCSEHYFKLMQAYTKA